MQKTPELDPFIIDHIEKYIKYHLERGYSKESVKEALLKFGYNNKMLEKIIKNLKILHRNLDKPYSEKDLEGETYYYLRSVIAEYIINQLEHGFSINEIKKALIKYGHHKNIIEDAIIIVKGKGKKKIDKGIIFWFCIVAILLFIIMMTLLLDVNFAYTFVIFTPGIAAFIFCRIALDYFYKIKEHLALTSVIISIILFFVIFPLLNKTDADTEVLIALNAAIAFITTYFYSKAEHKREVKRNGNKS